MALTRRCIFLCRCLPIMPVPSCSLGTNSIHKASMLIMNPSICSRNPSKTLLETSSNISQYSTQVLTEMEAKKIRNNENICWNCGKTLTLMSKNFCENCESILPLSKDEDFFSLLGIKRDFQISFNELQFNFKKFQILLHPDKFSLKTDTEKNISESVSSYLNKAYFTLLKPLSRGIYLLELHGEFVGENVNSDDPEFLMEILDLNEKIEDLNSVVEKRKLYEEMKTTVDELTEKIAEAFHENDVKLAKQHLISFKYYDNALQKLKELLPPV